MSEEKGPINHLYEALSKAQGEFPEIKKTKTNPYFKSKYADLSDIRDAVQPVLSKHGLFVSQLVQDGYLETILGHTGGGSLKSNMPINLSGKPQEIGSLLTYMRRYALAAILGVHADDDDDGNAAQRSKPKKADPPKKEEPQVTQDLGSYEIRLKGKYLGRTLNTFSDDELISFIDGLDAWSQNNNRPLAGVALEASQMASKYLEGKMQ